EVSASRIGATIETGTRSIERIRASVKKKRTPVKRRGQPAGRAATTAAGSIALPGPFPPYDRDSSRRVPRMPHHACPPLSLRHNHSEIAASVPEALASGEAHKTC